MSDEGSDQEDDLGSATLQLLTQEETVAINYSEIDDLKHVEGKNDTATYLPLKVKGGSLNSNKNSNVKHVKFLTEDQAKFVCNKVSTRREINTKTIQQEMNLTVTNAYKNALLYDVNKKKDPTQIEEWSVLSEHVKYVTHGESEAFHKLNIDLSVDFSYC